MLKITNILNSSQIKSHVSGVSNSLEEVSEHLTNSSLELSKTSSDAITSMHKALLSLKERPFLNLNSEAVKFFGLKCYQDMSLAKKEEIFTNLKINELGCKTFFPENASAGFIQGDSKLTTLFEKLNPDCGCARMTFYDKCFGGALHTIGFVRNKDTIYVLDSLGHNVKTASEIKQFHFFVNELLSTNMHKHGLNKVIFNHNIQQSMNEITCNHWTFANIENLIKALKSGKTIEDSTALDQVLPHDINKILDEQLDYMLRKTNRVTPD